MNELREDQELIAAMTAFCLHELTRRDADNIYHLPWAGQFEPATVPLAVGHLGHC